MCTFDSLPCEVVLNGIFPYIHPIQLWQNRRVSKTWHNWIGSFFRMTKTLNLDDSISEYYLTTEGLQAIIQSLHLLREIRLDACFRCVTEVCLISLANQCPRLEVLSIICCREVTDNVLLEIAEKCLNIRILQLNRCFQISDAGLEVLARSSQHLSELHVSKCYGVSDRGVAAILLGCPLLVELDVGGCYQVTDKSLRAIVEGQCKQLKWLRIKNCNGVSDRTVYGLYAAGVTVNNFF